MSFHPALTAGVFAAALLASSVAALAGGVAGDFDFYVLALSWSPGYCATDDNPDPAQCDVDHGFLVHGLWPEYEHGWPEYCASDLPATLSPSLVAAMADVMPNADLVAHQWRRHGLCSGLDAGAYFAQVRDAAARLTLPDDFAGHESPAEIETAFAAANRGLSEDAMSVQCRNGVFTEIRVCLTRNLAFRPCPEVDADRCRAPSIAVPAPE